jgi:hypothetical protein
MKTKTIRMALLSLAIAFLPIAGLQAQATLISQFDFNGNLNDDLGNATATPYMLGSSSYNAGTLHWTADTTSLNGGGLRISIPAATLTEKDYSIAVEFSFSEVDGYRKLIDFSQLGSDQGMYVNTSLRLYSIGNYGPYNWVADSTFTVLYTRSAADDSVRTYIYDGTNLQPQSMGQDLGLDFIASLNGLDRVFNFFMDDSSTTSEFSPMGSVGQIRIWNGIASLGEIVTSRQPESIGNGISLYPNPGRDQLNLHFSQPQSGTLQVFDASGKLVHSQQVSKNSSASLDMSSLIPGLYMIQLGQQSARWIKQ